MDDARQLRIGDQASPAPAEPMFATDEFLAHLLKDVESVLRGATSKISSVHRQLECRNGPPDPEPEPWQMRRALEFMADPANWFGSPHESRSILTGADTPYELALIALGRAA